MNKVKFLSIVLAAIAFAACATDNVDAPVKGVEEVALSKKIVNTSDNAADGQVLIYVDSEAANALESASGVTRSGISELDAIAAKIGATSIEYAFNLKVNADLKREMGLDRWFVVTFPEDADLQQVATQLSTVPSISRVQFNTKLTKPQMAMGGAFDPSRVQVTRATDFPFNDPMFDMQWDLKNTGNKSLSELAVEGADINVIPAWKHTTGNRNIIVSIVDEGIDHTHPDLKDNLWVNEAEKNGQSGVDDDGNGYVDDIYGYNFATNSGLISWTREGDVGHGTHVAGTIAAVNNNGVGIAGIAGGSGNNDGVRLMSCQIFSGDDTANLRQTARAIEYAADNGACISNNSWGIEPDLGPDNDNYFTQYMTVEYDAFKYFMAKKNCDAVDGGVVIIAAGNESYPQAGYPAAYNEFIAVTALASDGLPAYYTNYDKGCNVATYGGELEYSNNDPSAILSTVPKALYGTEYAYMQGTSMACPHASGMAALALSYALDNGITMSLKDFKIRMLTAVTDLNSKLTGSRTTPEVGTMRLDNYKNKMGTGSLDALLFLYNIRGEKCIVVPVGEEAEIKASELFGEGDSYLTLMRDFTISDEDRERLGITRNPDVFNGLFCIKCTKAGYGTVKLNFIAGGPNLGGGDTIGGMLVEKEVPIIARPLGSSNGGWL